MTIWDMEWNDRLRALMSEHGETNADIAPVLGVATPSGVTRYLSGERPLKVHQIIRLAEHYNVSIDYLLLGFRMDPEWKRARKRVAQVVSDVLKEKGVTAAEILKEYPAVNSAYLDELVSGKRDLVYTDIKLLGPMLGFTAASLLTDIISERDGPVAKRLL